MNMAASMALQGNPYIIGRPIYEPEYFFGREDLFSFIQDNLKMGAKVILLHGQRRIGKSSVLNQIPNFVQLEQFFCVPLSLEGKSQKLLSDILYDLALDIKDYLIDTFDLPFAQVTLPSKKDLEENPQVFNENFLPQVYEAMGGKNLVLLLDEFDVLDDYSKDTTVTHFFRYLKSLIDEQEKFFIIPVVGRRLDDMPNLLHLFHQAPYQRIGLLQEQSAKRLITKPAQGVLEYLPSAIQAILELSAGHPYFTQVICFALFSKARDEGRAQVTCEDVESVVDKAIEIGEAGLAWFYDGLPIPERVVFSAVAEAQQIVARKAELAEGKPLKLLQEYGVVPTESLKQSGEKLVEWGFLDLAEEPELLRARRPTYTVKIELVRRWLVKQHPLHREIWELEKLDLEAHRIYEEALGLQQQSYRLSDELKLYEQVLEINPNHFSALLNRAEICFELKEFQKAVELYTRAFQVDPVRNQDGFVQSLLSYGQELMQQGELNRAKQQFAKVLEIEPENVQVREQLEKVEAPILRPRSSFVKEPVTQEYSIGGSSDLQVQVLEDGSIQFLGIKVPYYLPGIKAASLKEVEAWVKVQSLAENFYSKFFPFVRRVIHLENVLKRGTYAEKAEQQYQASIYLEYSERYITRNFYREFNQLPETFRQVELIELIGYLPKFIQVLKRYLCLADEKHDFEIVKILTEKIRELLLYVIHVANLVVEDHLRRKGNL